MNYFVQYNLDKQGVIYIYSLLLVDDEKKVLDNIAQVFDWGEMGFSLDGTFTSAKAALEYMETNSVDLIISDISMPGMSGLDFAEIVLEKYPKTRFVVLSAYREFNFVQKAISCGVTDYILKPITFSKIEEVLKKAKTALASAAQIIIVNPSGTLFKSGIYLNKQLKTIAHKTQSAV